jgi:tripartite-type tricarboxylate transporter receptor subunit TctC
MYRLLSLAVGSLIGLTLAASSVLAQVAYPTRPIRMIVPFVPGGTTDVLARIIGERLEQTLGQPVVIENRGGAGGNIGADAVAKAPPDGYTLLVGTVGTHAINPSLYPKMPFDPIADFAPVAFLAAVPNIMVVSPKAVKATTVQEFIAEAKKAGNFSVASSGVGSSIHLTGELFKQVTGLDMTHVPYRGAGPALNDLMGGQVQVMFDNLPSSIQHARAGTLRAHGWTWSL